MASSMVQFHQNPNDKAPEGIEHNNNMTPIHNYSSLVEENSWTLYKYDFSRLERRESLLDGFVIVGANVSSNEQLLPLLQQNQIVDDPLSPGRCNYCFFRRSITPMWQDPLNCSGSRFMIAFSSIPQITPEVIHGYWKTLLQLLILQRFRYSPYITGVKVHWWLPKNHFISVWTSRNFANHEFNEMAEMIKRIAPNCVITHGPHNTILEKLRGRPANVNSTQTLNSTQAPNPIQSPSSGALSEHPSGLTGGLSGPKNMSELSGVPDP